MQGGWGRTNTAASDHRSSSLAPGVRVQTRYHRPWLDPHSMEPCPAEPGLSEQAQTGVVRESISSSNWHDDLVYLPRALSWGCISTIDTV